MVFHKLIGVLFAILLGVLQIGFSSLGPACVLALVLGSHAKAGPISDLVAAEPRLNGVAPESSSALTGRLHGEEAHLSAREGVPLSYGEDTSSAPDKESTQEAQEDAEPRRRWLVLDSVDERGRRPLRPDAVLDRYALENAFPREGEEVTGTSSSATWRLEEEDANGRLAVPGIGTAYRVFESEIDRVALLRLVGASTALVNGEACAGDVYAYGWATQLVLLRAGANHVFVSGIRGSFQLSFEEVTQAIEVAPWDSTIPDAIVGQDPGLLVGLSIFHADPRRYGSLFVHSSVAGLTVPTAQLGAPYLAPLSQRKLPLLIDLAEPMETARAGDEIEVTTTVIVVYDEGPPETREVECKYTFRIPVRDQNELQRRTFLSSQDLSVQEYCLRPPAPSSAGPDAQRGEPDRLLLSLHGAGVQAWGQAASYAARPKFWHVAATNRRPFGFDWQDWGRSDAYEVLEDALDMTGVSRRFVYLGGHSMGGHGTWHLGANDPDGFAAIAPSAGWRSFDTYGGRPKTELAWLWKQADGASDTEALLTNLKQVPTYILHGSADDNVPAAEAEAMFKLLQQAGAEPRMHIEEGQGHWWDAGVGPGVDCLAWPGFYELFRSVLLPVAPREIEFVSVHPSVDSQHYWVHVLQLEVYGDPARVRGSWSPEEHRVELELENVRRFSLDLPGWGGVETLRIGEQELAFPDGDQQLVLTGAGWSLENAPAPPSKRGVARPGAPRKTPRAGGPFKRAFDRNFLFVVPSGGSAEERSLTLAVARYHQAVWRYRGNGDVAIVRDVDLFHSDGELDQKNVGRNLILFGNEESNTAWRSVVRGLADLRVRPGSIRVGQRTFEGDDLTCLAVLPGQRDPDQLIGLVATTGNRALLLAPIQNLFISGAGFPDYLVFGSDVLKGADAGVRAAGWFDADWQLQPQHSVLR